MPQLSRGGKFIFGESQIRPDGCVRFPPQAVREASTPRASSAAKSFFFMFVSSFLLILCLCLMEWFYFCGSAVLPALQQQIDGNSQKNQAGYDRLQSVDLR